MNSSKVTIVECLKLTIRLPHFVINKCGLSLLWQRLDVTFSVKYCLLYNTNPKPIHFKPNS